MPETSTFGGLGHRDRAEWPLRARAAIETFLPAANRGIVYIPQPDSTESRQQVIAQKTAVQFSRATLGFRREAADRRSAIEQIP